MDDLDDLFFVPEPVLIAAIPTIPSFTLATSLKTASRGLRDLLLSFLPPKLADEILLQMEYMGPVRLDDIECAQAEVMATVRRFESR